MVDLMHELVALNWLRTFPDQDQPDWVFAWANIQPNAHQSPPFEDGHDIAPGVPGEGEPPGEIRQTTPPPRIHTKTRIGQLLRGWWRYANATEVTDDMVRAFRMIYPEVGSPATVRYFLAWALRQGLFERPRPATMAPENSGETPP